MIILLNPSACEDSDFCCSCIKKVKSFIVHNDKRHIALCLKCFKLKRKNLIKYGFSSCGCGG